MMHENNDTTSHVMDEMDPALLTFLQTKVNSFIKWDLVRFFHHNPHTTDTAGNVARYTGRDARTIQVELNELVSSGVLSSQQVGEFKVYTLTDAPDVRALIARFVEASEDREFRVRAIYHVIRGMR